VRRLAQQLSVRLQLRDCGGIALRLACREAFAVGAGARAQMRKVRTGPETLVGATGVARNDLTPLGDVFVRGEFWQAKSLQQIIPGGERVRVVRVTGLRLDVEKAEEPE